MMKINVTSKQAELIDRATEAAWDGYSEIPCWDDGMSSIDANEGFFHGSMFIGSISRSGSAWVITSRHDVKYIGTDLYTVVRRFISEYSTARLEGRA